MLNKRLVIAALLAATQAQDTPAAETPAAETPAAETPAAETPAAETPAAETPAEEPAAEEPAEEKTEEKAEGSGSDGLEFERARRAWKEVLADGTTERVLCDQGESALWEEAQEKFADLEARLATATADLATDLAAYTPLNDALTAATDAANAHRAAGAAYLAAWTAAGQTVNDLTAAAGGTDGTSAANVALALLTANTAAAEAAVATQRARVEVLIEAKRTQDQEEALWSERVTEATTAKQTAEEAKQTAETAQTEAEQQVSTRSWLFEVLREINTTSWAALCNSGGNAKCILAETARATTSASTWAWPANCNYQTSSGLTTTNHNCTIMGLSPDSGTGLIQAATAAKGTIATTSPVAAATELYLAYENADYDVVSATYQVNSANSSRFLKALDIYETWQKSAIMVEMMKVACWKTQSGSSNTVFAGADSFEGSWCHFNNANQDAPTGGQHFHPLIQGIGNPRALVSIDATALAAKGTFGDGTGSDTSITVALQVARATAQVNLWFADWVSTALDEDWVLTGKAANKASELTSPTPVAGDTWYTRTIGAAEFTVASKTALLAAAQANLDAAGRWKATAESEAQAADADLVRGRALLADLTMEIAPIARMEIDARNAVTAAVDEQAERVVAAQQLGVLAVTDAQGVVTDPATGARAVLAAALKTKESVEAQQAFHDDRVEWATDNLAPAKAEWEETTQRVATLTAMRDAALEKFDDAREQCKRAAFEAAQEAREEAVRVAEAKALKSAEVLKAYTALAAFPTDGSAGTLCHYAKTAADAAQTPRTECAEGDPGKPLCCGAAQRFLKDGTKLSIETCQLATDTTYTYYPALPSGALVAPTAETWRFQCISAAQKLAAAATAALAAGYMMA